MAMRKQPVSNLVLRLLRHHYHYHYHTQSSPLRIVTSSIPCDPIQSQPNRFRCFYFSNNNNNRFLTPYNLYSSNRSFSTGGQLPGFFVEDSASGEEAILPVRCLVSALDTLHHLTAIPWWMTIIISTVALRVTILPVLLLQLQKLKTNAQLVSQ